MELDDQPRWRFAVRTSPGASVRLFCLPYAGGTAQVFAGWGRYLPLAIDVWALQFPGRGARLRERPLTDVQAMSEGVADAIAPLADRPFVLFGHSMGAFVAFEVARTLRRRGRPAPAHLVLSGAGAPDLPQLSEPIHHLPEAEFLEKIRSFNGTPSDVFASAEMLAMVLPILRADFMACDTYVSRTEPPLDVPITVCAGTDDPDSPRHYIEAWQRHTTMPMTVHWFEGDHFFINTFRETLLQHIDQIVRAMLVLSRSPLETVR